MNLGEQLQELREVVLRDRSDLIAGDADSLWTDETLLRYIGDAEYRFARETCILRDATTAKFTRITLREGVRDYALPTEVFAVMSARPAGQDYDLKRTGHCLVQARPVDTSLTFDPAETLTLSPGAPLGFYTDETIVFARQVALTVSIFPTPDATAAGTIVSLRVVRTPEDKYGRNCTERASEIPRGYQLDVLEWAAYRAKRNNDADIGAMPNADSHKDAFEAAIKRAQKEVRERTQVQTGLAYGSNGFSWGR